MAASPRHQRDKISGTFCGLLPYSSYPKLFRYVNYFLKQVAAVGYSSHAHFTQLYARHTGQLPVSLTRQRPA